MYDRPAVTALRESLASIVKSHPAPFDAERHDLLRDRVWATVDDLKGAGWPPERVIVAVKQIALDVGLHPSREIFKASTDLSERDRVIVDMVRWCIDRYYQNETPSA